jgi:2-hydroxychromene-2-carboxylate isomerase
VWEEPERHPGLTANLAGVVVRDRSPELFPAVHFALFTARHDKSLDLREKDILSKVLDEAGADGAHVLSEIDSGWPLDVLKAEHTEAVEEYQAFGVPTFLSGEQSVFVRLMNRPAGDGALATATIERLLDLMAGWPDLNEFKHTSLSH